MTTPTTNTDNGLIGLYGKMVKIMAEIPRIPKDGHNDYFKYDFARAGDVSDTIRALMVKYNIAFSISMTSLTPLALISNKDKKYTKSIAGFDIALIDADTGQRELFHWMNEADDEGDKGGNKAATAALKYFLLTTFLIPTGDEGNEEQEPEQTPQQLAAAAELANDRKRFIASANAKGYGSLEAIGAACEKYNLSIDNMTYRQMAEKLPVFVAA